MKNNDLLADTNIFGYILMGEEPLGDFLHRTFIFCSIISKIELMCARHYTKQDLAILKDLMDSVTIVQTNDLIAEYSIKIRRSYNLKIADSIIVGTSWYLGVPLITADKELFKVKEVDIIEYQPTAR